MTARLLGWLAAFPSTNGRIVVSLLLALATGARVVFRDWHPDPEWLVFLTAWAGLDVVQWGAKRVTNAEHVAAKHTATHAVPKPEGP